MSAVGDKYTTITKRPDCDLCRLLTRTRTPAYANAKLTCAPSGMLIPVDGWAYVCSRHFREQECQIGAGYGQRLIMKRARPRQKPR